MSFNFKIWDQGNDGKTMAVRVEDVGELARFAAACSQPDIAGRYVNLRAYLTAAGRASGAPPQPYSRVVDIVWLKALGYRSPQFFPGRTLVATYTGPERNAGGYASQCYCIVDPDGFRALRRHHRTVVSVEYVASPGRDVLVVLP